MTQHLGAPLGTALLRSSVSPCVSAGLPPLPAATPFYPSLCPPPLGASAKASGEHRHSRDRSPDADWRLLHCLFWVGLGLGILQNDCVGSCCVYTPNETRDGSPLSHKYFRLFPKSVPDPQGCAGTDLCGYRPPGNPSDLWRPQFTRAMKWGCWTSSLQGCWET